MPWLLPSLGDQQPWYWLLYNVFLMLVYNISDANLILSCRDSAWRQRWFNLKIRPNYRIHWTDEPFCMEDQTIRIHMTPLRTLPYAGILYYKDLCWPEVTCRLHLSRVTLLGNRIYREYIPRVNCWTVYCCAHTLHCKLYTVDTQTSVYCVPLWMEIRRVFIVVKSDKLNAGTELTRTLENWIQEALQNLERYGYLSDTTSLSNVDARKCVGELERISDVLGLLLHCDWIGE